MRKKWAREQIRALETKLAAQEKAAQERIHSLQNKLAAKEAELSELRNPQRALAGVDEALALDVDLS